MQEIDIYTDASCEPNPGHCGYAAILKTITGATKTVAGAIRKTTANRAKMYAIYYGLNALKKPCIVNIHTNLNYLLGSYDKIKKYGVDECSNNDIWKDIVNFGYELNFKIFCKRDELCEEQILAKDIANTYALMDIAETDAVDVNYERTAY